MDPYDKEKTREIWKRVLGDECREVHATDSEKLRGMIAGAMGTSRVLRAWARCGFGDELCRIAEEAQRHSRMLETVYYLWTGHRAAPCRTELPRYAGMAQMLRAVHAEMRESAAACRQAAEELPEHRGIFCRIAADKDAQAERLFRLLQRCIAQ